MKPEVAIVLLAKALEMLAAYVKGRGEGRFPEEGLAKVRQLIAEERSPTDEEWLYLETELDSQYSRLRAALDRLESGDQEEDDRPS